MRPGETLTVWRNNRAHAPRGHAFPDALRPILSKWRRADAGRHEMQYHAEA
ncbi:Unknown protein sequence [Pseudomonas coronafaciens pv. oryzae]|nr:Unknown protein sequence [Pseudomonas coronafaciens pv. oryzae]